MSVVKVEGVKVELLGKMNREKRNTAGIGPDRYSPSEESERQVPTKDKKEGQEKEEKWQIQEVYSQYNTNTY